MKFKIMLALTALCFTGCASLQERELESTDVELYAPARVQSMGFESVKVQGRYVVGDVANSPTNEFFYLTDLQQGEDPCAAVRPLVDENAVCWEPVRDEIRVTSDGWTSLGAVRNNTLLYSTNHALDGDPELGPNVRISLKTAKPVSARRFLSLASKH